MINKIGNKRIIIDNKLTNKKKTNIRALNIHQFINYNQNKSNNNKNNKNKQKRKTNDDFNAGMYFFLEETRFQTD